MKRGLLLGSLTLLSIVSMLVFNPRVETEYYQPRESDAEEGINGAIAYYNMLRANPTTGVVSQAEVIAAREEVLQHASRQRRKSAIGLDWEDMGPTNYGGRARAFLIEKDNPNIMFVGSVSGGLFKSTNSGNSWRNVSDPLSNPAVVSLAQSSNGTLYYGTGEGLYFNYSGTGTISTPALVGGGMYKSTDGGETWTIMPSTTGFGDIGKIEVSPNNPNQIYAATSGGLKMSTDGGENWTNPVSGLAQFQATLDLTISSSGEVWAKSGNTIQKSEDGITFTEITNSSNLPRNGARMRIAISPQDDDYVYVISIDPSNGAFDKGYKSSDGGQSWTVIGQRTTFLNPHSSQGQYDNAVTVDPKNKERIIIGGVTLWEWSEQGGWQQLATNFGGPGNQLYVHSDIHNVVFSKTDLNTFYIVCDGGVHRTQNDGLTYTTLNNNFSTIQFYHIGVGPNGKVLGGTQDNSNHYLEPMGSNFPTRSRELFSGDGGYGQLSKLYPGVLFLESQRGNMARSSDNGASFDPFLDLDRMDPANFYGTSSWASWVAPFKLWEKLDDPLSEDSVIYGADTIKFSLGFGNGATKFVGNFPLPQSHGVYKMVNGNVVVDSGVYTPQGVTFTAGNQQIVSDANGNFSGDGSGTFDATNGRFEITFNTPVVVELFGASPVQYEPGNIIELKSAINDLPLYDTVKTTLTPGTRTGIVDPRQSMFFVGLVSHRVGKVAGKYTRNHFGGIWMTREVLSKIEKTPQWLHIANLANNEEPTCMAVSSDGDKLYVGTREGRVYRISNLASARDSASADIDSLYISNTFIRASTSILETKTLGSFGGQVVTSISVHPNDGGRVIVTLGNYGRTNYVYLNTDADLPTPGPFIPVTGDLPKIPVYSSTFNFTGSPNQVIIGTEYGIYTTDNVTSGSVSWTQEINGFVQVPVFELVQDLTVRYDLKDENDFEGSIYAGTHGRGVWRTHSTSNYVTVGQDEHEIEEATSRAVLNIYPNPATDKVAIELDLQSRSDVEISVRDMNGKLVKQVRFDNLAKETKEVELRISGLPRGAYVVHLIENGQRGLTGKIIKQ